MCSGHAATQGHASPIGWHGPWVLLGCCCHTFYQPRFSTMPLQVSATIWHLLVQSCCCCAPHRATLPLTHSLLPSSTMQLLSLQGSTSCPFPVGAGCRLQAAGAAHLHPVPCSVSVLLMTTRWQQTCSRRISIVHGPCHRALSALKGCPLKHTSCEGNREGWQVTHRHACTGKAGSANASSRSSLGALVSPAPACVCKSLHIGMWLCVAVSAHPVSQPPLTGDVNMQAATPQRPGKNSPPPRRVPGR